MALEINYLIIYTMKTLMQMLQDASLVQLVDEAVIPLGEDGETYLVSKEYALTEDDAYLLFFVAWLCWEGNVQNALEMANMTIESTERVFRMRGEDEMYDFPNEGEKGKDYWIFEH